MKIIVTHSLNKKFGGLIAIDNIDFALEEGELRCIIGPNGAGKSTFFSLLSGHLYPDKGEIYFFGEKITKFSVQKRAFIGIGRKFQTPAVFDELSVFDNIRVSTRGKSSLISLFLHKFDANFDQIAERLLLKVHLEGKYDWPASKLSHGERQWLEIAMVLANNPKLLLLDEPTAGMTPAETLETAKLLKDISAKISTIVIEHDLKFVREIASTITVFHKGALLTEGNIKEVSDNLEVKRVYLGREEL